MTATPTWSPFCGRKGSPAFSDGTRATTSKLPSAQTVYECRKTDERIVIDGVLDENAWRRAPVMPQAQHPFCRAGSLKFCSKINHAIPVSQNMPRVYKTL